MKKNILLGTIMLLVALASFTSCQEERTTYSGSQYIMFADTLSVLGVEDKDEYFDIYISGTRPMSKDQTLAVEVIEQESSAIYNHHPGKHLGKLARAASNPLQLLLHAGDCISTGVNKRGSEYKFSCFRPDHN